MAYPHPCVVIPEIIQHICNAVYFTRDGTIDYFTDLASLAKVNQGFRSWAVELMWTDLDSAIPLLLSLPKNLWKFDKEQYDYPCLVFTRDPTQEEMEEFFKRSQCIRHLTLPHRLRGSSTMLKQLPPSEFLLEAPMIYRVLSNAAVAPLFPNLVSLTVPEPSSIFEPLYRHLPPNLSALYIQHPFKLGLRLDSTPLMEHIATYHSLLLNLSAVGMPPHQADKLICALPRLRHLSVLYVRTPGFLHIASLSTLESLQMQFDERLPFDLLGESPFPSLRSLTSSCSSLVVAIKLVHKLACSPIVYLSMKIRALSIDHTRFGRSHMDEKRPSCHAVYNSAVMVERQKGLWIELFKVIGKSVQRSSLEFLEIFEDDWYPQDTVLPFDALKPLLTFTHLRELRVITSDGIIMHEGDEDVVQQCIGSLEVMTISLPPPPFADPNLTFW
ncbi:hypothetical protein H0H93_016114 [Arthromyces matolae]|nr:hypothetical protein H0H93_016114 [Arthromyces matolae]